MAGADPHHPSKVVDSDVEVVENRSYYYFIIFRVKLTLNSKVEVESKILTDYSTS